MEQTINQVCFLFCCQCYEAKHLIAEQKMFDRNSHFWFFVDRGVVEILKDKNPVESPFGLLISSFVESEKFHTLDMVIHDGCCFDQTIPDLETLKQKIPEIPIILQQIFIQNNLEQLKKAIAIRLWLIERNNIKIISHYTIDEKEIKIIEFSRY